MAYLVRIFSSRRTFVLAWGCGLLFTLAGTSVVRAESSVSGNITLLGSGLEGVLVCITGPESTCVTSNTDGDYVITPLSGGGTYTLTPTLQDYAFEPSSVKTTLGASQQKEVDFLACHQGEPLSGTLFDTATNRPVANQTITADGHSSATAADGTFSIDGLACGTPTVAATVPAGYFPVDFEWDTYLSWQVNIYITRLDSVFGSPANTKFAGRGVNTSTGNYTLQSTDLTLPGIGAPFIFERTYNSQAASAENAVDGPLGYGWTHTFNLYIDVDANLDAIVHRGDGHSEVYKNEGSGAYIGQYGIYNALTQAGDSTFTLYDHGTVYQFDSDNRLISVTDPNGNPISLTRDASGLLTNITDAAGRTFDVTNDANGHITRISRQFGRSINFAYDTNGNLTSATDALGNVTHYTYDGAHRLVSVTVTKNGKDATTVTNTYDTSLNAVTEQEDAANNTTTFSYDLPTAQTIVTDPLNNITKYHYNVILFTDGRLDANNNASFWQYDGFANLAAVTDNNGNTTHYAYDSAGNLTTVTDALGNVTSTTRTSDSKVVTDPLGHKTITTYTANTLAVSDALGDTTTYTYDNNG
jgi:YD repeat-containing protein